MTKVEQEMTEAKKQLEKLQAAVAEWSKRADAARESMDAAEEGTGEELLAIYLAGDEKKAVSIQEGLSRRRAEYDAATKTALAAHRAAQKAKGVFLKAQAAECRETAGKLQQEAEKHQKRTDELLAAIIEHEETPDLQLAAKMREPTRGEFPSPFQPAGKLRTIRKSEVLLNKSKTLQEEASKLEQEAVRLEAGPLQETTHEARQVLELAAALLEQETLEEIEAREKKL